MIFSFSLKTLFENFNELVNFFIRYVESTWKMDPLEDILQLPLPHAVVVKGQVTVLDLQPRTPQPRPKEQESCMSENVEYSIIGHFDHLHRCLGGLRQNPTSAS
jgi:hypothetical protein